MASNVDVIVVGAGIAGVATAKNLLQEGLNVKVIEATDHVAGLWQFTEKGYGVTSFTHINVSKHNYCFSDYPFPEDTPDFPSHVQMAKYVNDYTDHFGVRDHIIFNTRVTHLTKEGEKWKVTTTNNSEEKKVFYANAVAIASGHHAIPVFPNFPNENKFKGEIYHAVDFKDAKRNNLVGKRVLVVGIGNSAVDIVTHATAFCPHVTISTRSGAWVYPNYIFGWPTDFYACRAFLYLPWRLGSMTMEALITMLAGHPRNYGLNPKFHAFQTQPTVSPTLLHTIQRGYVDVKPNVKEFHETGVIFEDGTRAEYDTVIYSTGYRIDLPYLDESIKKSVLNEHNNEIHLYKNVFSPEIGKTLAFIGFVQPFSGGILCMAETQARWFGELLKGKVKLPSPSKMESAIKSDMKKILSRFSNRGRHTIQQDPIIYTDEIASFIGAKPTLLRNPLLFFHLLFGSCGTYQYRLQGPGKWSEASKWVRKAPPTPMMRIVGVLVILLFLTPAFVRLFSLFLAKRALRLKSA